MARALPPVACGLTLAGCLPAHGPRARPPPAAAGAPRTVVLEGAALVALRHRLRTGDPLLRAALARLFASADSELTIYAWPNPKTADGLPWVTRDASANPAPLPSATRASGQP